MVKCEHNTLKLSPVTARIANHARRRLPVPCCHVDTSFVREQSLCTSRLIQRIVFINAEDRRPFPVRVPFSDEHFP